MTVEVGAGPNFLTVIVQKLQSGFGGGSSIATWIDTSRTITCLDPSFLNVDATDFDSENNSTMDADWDCDFTSATVSFADVP